MCMVENKKQNFAGHLGHISLFLSSCYMRLQKLHHLSELVACATDNCKNVVNHFVSIKLTCIIITGKTCVGTSPHQKCAPDVHPFIM